MNKVSFIVDFFIGYDLFGKIPFRESVFLIAILSLLTHLGAFINKRDFLLCFNFNRLSGFLWVAKF